MILDQMRTNGKLNQDKAKTADYSLWFTLCIQVLWWQS